MSDLISRQAAIKAIEEEWDECCSEYPATQIIRDTTEAIERLPIIQPKRGRWIGKYPVTSVCSECGFLIHDSKVKVFAFCPNCGAKMEVTMRAIDADALKIAIEDNDNFVGGSYDIIQVVNAQPTIQPEIVRCKDCKYAEYIDDVQTLWCTECGQGRTVAPNDFCSYAERRTDE